MATFIKLIQYCAVTLFLITRCEGLLLSQSKVEMCENKGVGSGGDPRNLVDGKSCTRKMMVSMTVKNNQKEGTEKLQATVSRILDKRTNEYARLYNPFMITVSKSPVLINYPFIPMGKNVNNRPYEVIRKSTGTKFGVNEKTACRDNWPAKDTPQNQPTCGYSYKMAKKLQQDGVYRNVRVREWASQGFCCRCTKKEAMKPHTERDYSRSGMSCSRNSWYEEQSAAHCMRMDDLWYSVSQFRESIRDFTIHIRAYDQVEKVHKDKKVLDYVNGGEIIIGPGRKGGVGKYNRIIAEYVGDFSPVVSYPVLTERYFLIPKTSPKVVFNDHAQTKDGVRRYLIMPYSYVDLYGKACNKIGVSYDSFKNQAADGKGYGCQQKKGFCLSNQPYHYYMEDMRRIRSGKSPHYFPERFGKVVGLRKSKASEEGKVNDEIKHVLSFELEEDHTSLITLQISADDLVFVYNRAAGEIVRTGIKDFEALTSNGKLHVDVMNIGYVTADFFIGVPLCSKGIQQVQERTKSIDPQKLERLVFNLRTYSRVAGIFVCTVELYDSKRTLLARRNISFSTSSTCTCETLNCACECAGTGSVKCIAEDRVKVKNEIWDQKLKKWKSARGVVDNISIVGLGVFNLFGKVLGTKAWRTLRWLFLLLIVLFYILLFLNCGGLQMYYNRKVELKRRRLERKGNKKKEIEHNKTEKKESENNETEKKESENNKTEKKESENNKTEKKESENNETEKKESENNKTEKKRRKKKARE